MKRRAVTLGMVALMVAAGCEDPATPGGAGQDLGIVAWTSAPSGFVAFADLPGNGWTEDDWGARPPLMVPDEVDRGVPFTAVVTTALPSGCWSAGGQETSTAPLSARITVYDHRSNAEVCTLLFGWATREIELRFDEPGEAVVRLVGRRVVGDAIDDGQEMVVERRVMVR